MAEYARLAASGPDRVCYHSTNLTATKEFVEGLRPNQGDDGL